MTINMLRSAGRASGLITAALLLTGTAAHATTAQTRQGVAVAGRIDVSAGDLGPALRRLALRTGTNILYSSRLVDGLRARPVRGAASVSDALTQMLRGTGLGFTVQPDGSVWISRRRPTAAVSAPSPTPHAVETALETTRLEDVVVNGRYAQSLSIATAVKRDADIIQDSLSSQDVGDFPARNVGEALARIPGVSVDRIGPGGRGESLSINLRGLPANFQTVQLNGRDIAVGENVESSLQYGRSFRYDILPPDLISRVDVAKTTTAAMAEGGIAGSIDIQTYRPLDLGATTVLSGKTLYNELADRGGIGLAVLASRVNADETLGLVVTASHADRRERQDSDFSDPWTRGRDSTFAANKVSFADVYLPSARRPTVENYRKERTTGTLALQYRPSEHLETRADILYARQDSPYSSAGISFQLPAAQIDQASATVVDNVLMAGRSDAVEIATTAENSLQQHTLFSAGLNQTWKPGAWTVSADLQRSEAGSRTRDPIRRVQYSLVAPARFDFSRGVGHVPDLVPGVSLTDSTQAYVGSGSMLARIERSKMTVSAGRLDVSRGFHGRISAVKAGVGSKRLDRKYFRLDRISPLFRGTLAAATPGALRPIGSPDVFGALDGDFPRQWLSPNLNLLFDQFFDQTLLQTAQSASDLAASSTISENTQTAYILGAFDFGVGTVPVTGNLGVRVLRTVQTSTGYANAGAMTGAVPVSYKRPYAAVLPSANLKAELTDSLFLRLAYSRQLSPPQLELLAPALSVTISAGFGVGGNPNLEAYRSNNYDASLEWYFHRDARLSAAVFVKDFDSYLTQQVTQLVIPNTFGVEFYNITSQVNGGEARLRGLELAYQQTFSFLPGPWAGLGVEAALTRVIQNAEFVVPGGRTVRDSLLGVSPMSFSLVGFYERSGVSARLGYSWRARYLTSVGGAGSTDGYFDDFGSLDANLSCEPAPGVQFTIEAFNLTGRTTTSIARLPDGRELPGSAGYFGRNFSFGVSARF